MKKTFKIFSALGIMLIIMNACSSDECTYETFSNPGCDAKGRLNLSTGIDANENVLAPGDGVVDPFWRVINKPPLINCTNTLANTINGSAYAINYNNFGPDQWVNQTGSTTIAPVDLGTTHSFGCNNPENSNGEKVPYVFERPFCVLDNTKIDFSFTFKGDDQVYFELIDNASNTVLSTSPTYTWTVDPVQTWSVSGMSLSSGSYSIRGYLVNTYSVVLGMSFVGSLVTTNGDNSISNNVDGCCENNTLSILNIVEAPHSCNQTFDTTDQVGPGWVFNLKDSSGSIIRTETSDINGNVFFSGLPDGTYTVEIVAQPAWAVTSPASGSYTVSLDNNQVEFLDFYNCPINP